MKVPTRFSGRAWKAAGNQANTLARQTIRGNAPSDHSQAIISMAQAMLAKAMRIEAIKASTASAVMPCIGSIMNLMGTCSKIYPFVSYIQSKIFVRASSETPSFSIRKS